MTELNRAQRRQLARKLKASDSRMPSLSEWLSEPGKVVKRGECYNLIHRVWKIRELDRRYNSWHARFQRWIARTVPWMDDPPDSPFDLVPDSDDA